MPAARRLITRPPAPPAAPAPGPAAPSIDLFAPWPDPRTPDRPPVSHLGWAENVARMIARRLGLGPRSDGAEDLVAVAHATLVRLAARFDFARVPPGGSADGQFRGLAATWLRKECEREYERLTNGGLYSTTGDPEAKAAGRRVGELPLQARCPNCRDVQGWWADEDEDEPIVVRHEPTLLIVRDGRAVSLNGAPVADLGDGVGVECVE